jgi:uncharacterized membrane protein YjfL (UPF0719 family)
MEQYSPLITDFGRAMAFVGLYFVLFLLAKWMKDFFTPYKINDELTKQDNPAIALTMCGYYFGVLAVFVGAMFGSTQGLVKDLMLVGGYAILGIIFLNISRYINDKVILRKFSNIEQLTKERNIAVGAVQFGTYVATGLIAAGAVTGSGGGWLTAIIFFILGQVSLLIFSIIYGALTPYCIHDELERKNLAAGIALGGSLIALGIIVLNGVSGDFLGWTESLIDLLVVNCMAFVFLPVVRFVMDKLVVPGDSLSREIIEDKNIGAGLLEAVVAISFAIVLKLVV